MKTRAFRQSRPYSRRRPVPFSVPCSLAVGAVFLASGPIAAATGPEIRAEIVEPARLRISWSDASRGFGLETTADLSPGVDWAVVEEVVAGPGDGWSVTLPLNERERYFRLREGAVPALASLIRTSPRNGEAGVSVNRETILEFSRALAADAVVDAGNFRARFGGRSLLSRVELSPDRRRATLFPLEPFPAGSRLQISLVGDGLRDDLGREVDADGDGFPGGTARLEFDTMSAAALPGTAVTGHVYASDPEPVGGAFANRRWRACWSRSMERRRRCGQSPMPMDFSASSPVRQGGSSCISTGGWRWGATGPTAHITRMWERPSRRKRPARQPSRWHGRDLPAPDCGGDVAGGSSHRPDDGDVSGRGFDGESGAGGREPDGADERSVCR